MFTNSTSFHLFKRPSKSLSSQEGLEVSRVRGVRAGAEAKRPEGEKCTIDFGDLDPELVRALLKDGGRIWATCPPGGRGKGLLFPRPEIQKKYGVRALTIEINGYEITITDVIQLK